MMWIASVLLLVSVVLPFVAGLGAISGACSGSLFLLALLIAGRKYARVSWMRSAARVGIFVVTPLALTLLTIFGLIEQGETLVLRTFDASGTPEETRLWVVDYDGSPWLGAGGGETRRWYQRLEAVPEVEAIRKGITECYEARPSHDPQVRDAVIEETRRKYRLGNLGLAIGNRLGIPMRTNSIAIAIRLVAGCEVGDEV